MKKKKTGWILLIVLLASAYSIITMPEIEPEYIEVTTEDTVFENKFYFEQFSEEEQVVYKEVYQGLFDSHEEFNVHSNDTDLVNELVASVMLDFPEIFWTDGTGTSTTYDEAYISIKPTYIYEGEEKEKREDEIESEAAKILSNVPTDASEYEKIKYIYESLVETVTYVEDAPDNQNIYSAIVGKESVCAGYAKANQYLLEQLGISCIYVTGTAIGQDGEDAHAWNIVKCDGKFYYVDVTWADWSWLNEDNQTTEELLYDYLCCDEQVLAETHEINEDYVFPECNSTDLNYYRLHQMYYETVNRTELLDAAYRTIDAQGERTMYKFSDAEIYNQAKDLLINELIDTSLQHLCEKYRLQEAECLYEEQDDLNRFIIYWEYE